jgi:hypothetical protein
VGIPKNKKLVLIIVMNKTSFLFSVGLSALSFLFCHPEPVEGQNKKGYRLKQSSLNSYKK